MTACSTAILCLLAINMVCAQKFSKHSAPIPLLILITAVSNGGAMSF